MMINIIIGIILIEIMLALMAYAKEQSFYSWKVLFLDYNLYILIGTTLLLLCSLGILFIIYGLWNW